jgi:hypothetical protein
MVSGFGAFYEDYDPKIIINVMTNTENVLLHDQDIANVLIWVTSHCNRAAVSRNRYGVEKTVDIHKILINAINLYVCLQEIR